MPRIPRPIQSVERAILILDVLSGESAGLPLQTLAKRLFLPPQTVQSLLRTLELHDWVAQDGRGAPYKLGTGLRHVASGRAPRDVRGSLARNLVIDLAKDIGESVLLAERSGRRAAPLAQARFERPLAVTPDAEGLQGLHVMATGKVLMAGIPEPARSVFVRSLTLFPRTERTATDPSDLLRQLATVSRQGWAETVDESEIGIAALAVPVPAEPGQQPAALGTCLPTARYNPDRRPVLLAALQACAKAIQQIWQQTAEQ
jgi:DNA-binding IclR family transcriptional regulator